MRISGVGAARIEEFCRDLSLKYDHNIIVFTEAGIPSEKPGRFKLSSSLLVYKFPVIQVPRIFFNPLTVILITILGWYILRKNPPDIIIGAVPEGEPGVISYFLSRVFKIPLIMDIRDIWLESYTRERIFKRIFFGIYSSCSYITVVTKTLVDFYVQEYNIPPEKISIIHNGARIRLTRMNISKEYVRQELGLPTDKIIFSFIGVLSSHNDFRLMFEAIKKLTKNLLNCLVLIVGDGSQMPFCKVLVKKLHLEKKVRFYGWVSPEIANKYMFASDLGISPLADIKGTDVAIPTKIFHYMALGVPTLVFGKSNWEISQFFKETRAGLICPHDPDEIAKCILHLITDENVLKDFSKNGRRAILETYSRERGSLKMNKIINLVL